MSTLKTERPTGVTFLAIFHVLVGALGVLAGVVLTGMAFAFGGGFSLGLILTAALAVAGILYAVAGIYLLSNSRRKWNRSIMIQLFAILVAVVFLGSIFYSAWTNGNLDQLLDPQDEEAVMFALLPVAAVAIAVVELIFLWRMRPKV